MFLDKSALIAMHLSCRSSLRRAEKDNMIQYYYDQCTKYYGGTLPFQVDALHRAYDFVFPFGMSFYATSVPMIGTSAAIVGEEGQRTVPLLYA